MTFCSNVTVIQEGLRTLSDSTHLTSGLVRHPERAVQVPSAHTVVLRNVLMNLLIEAFPAVSAFLSQTVSTIVFYVVR